jgi:hypothetical protein
MNFQLIKNPLIYQHPQPGGSLADLLKQKTKSAADKRSKDAYKSHTQYKSYQRKVWVCYWFHFQYDESMY